MAGWPFGAGIDKNIVVASLKAVVSGVNRALKRAKGTAMKRKKPYLSNAPWAGLTKHERARATPLDACPSPRCRRRNACVDAHDGLYCQRTHFSPTQIRQMLRNDPLEKAVAALPKVRDQWDFEGRGERIKQISELRLAHHEKMTARWKAGEFDDTYGKYTAKGVLMKPPPKVYVEPAKNLSSRLTVGMTEFIGIRSMIWFDSIHL